MPGRRWHEPARRALRLAADRRAGPALAAGVRARAGDRDCDVFLSTNSYLSVILTRRAVGGDRLRPRGASTARRRPTAARRSIERLTLGAAVRRARGLVCISEQTAVGADRPHARGGRQVDRRAARRRDRRRSRHAPRSWGRCPTPGFVLAVGTLEPRKNLPRLVAAYAPLPERRCSAPSAGGRRAAGWRTGETLAALTRSVTAATLGHVSDAAARRALPPLRGVLLSVAGRGIRTSRARGDGRRGARAHLQRVLAARGRRRRRRLRRSSRYRVDRRRAPRIARGSPAARDPRASRLARAAEFSWTRFAGEVLAALEHAAQASVRS